LNSRKHLFAVSFPFPLEDPGLAIMLAIPSMGGDMTELEKNIDAEIEKLQNELISDQEFEKLRNMIESSFITANSTMAGIAESLADYYVYTKRVQI
jgi:zinc protease